jgi:hypothetical protein
MYQDEHEEVIHDTLEAEEKALEDKADEILSEHLLVKHLRNIVKQEIAKKFDDGPGVNNDIEELINNKLERFVESDDFKYSVKEEMDNYIDDCYVEVDTTAYITKG